MSEKASYNVSNEEQINHCDVKGYNRKPGRIATSISGIENMALEPDLDDSGKTDVNKLTRKLSQISVVSKKSKTRFSDNGDDNLRSWWYTFCMKCNSKQSNPESWQPKYWSYLCPHPYCPDYRSFARFLTLVIIGVVSWCILYIFLGEIAGPPKGKLFQLLILFLAAKFGGWLITLTTLPGLIGMLFTGMIMQNLDIVDIDSSFSTITGHLRKISLVIILVRAGLDLDPSALRRLKWSVVKIGLGPWVVEATLVAVLGHFLLSIPWDYGIALGSAAVPVSPAVTVVCLLRLRAKGYGVAKGIPTLIIAIAGIDSAVSIAAFGIIKSAMFSNGSLIAIILQVPLSVVGGIAFGVFWGLLCYFAPEKKDPFVTPLRIILLLVGCTISVLGSDYIGYGGAGPLGCVAGAFTAGVVWSKQGWKVQDNPASEGFQILWMFFEPILFAITGAQVKLDQLDGHVVLIGLGLLTASIVIRIIITIILGSGCGLNLKEKFFCAFALIAKATVQAALAPVLLGLVKPDSVEYSYAEKVFMICILYIIVTAPISAVLITILGPRLLSKTSVPLNVEILTKRLSIKSIGVDADKEVSVEDANTNELPLKETRGDDNKTKM